jgi:hypothetical protein
MWSLAVQSLPASRSTMSDKGGGFIPEYGGSKKTGGYVPPSRPDWSAPPPTNPALPGNEEKKVRVACQKQEQKHTQNRSCCVACACRVTGGAYQSVRISTGRFMSDQG